MNAIVTKSANFLTAVLQQKVNIFDDLHAIESLSKESLIELDNREKLMFWINLYNGFVQLEMRNIGTDKIYASMFTEELFTVAGEHLSLDIIEHGILRGNRWKYGLGYIRGGHLPKRIRYWRCKKLDYRIHFLLNCGAASCPVIRVLDENNLDAELNAAEKYFVQSEVEEVGKEASNKKYLLPSLFMYYLGDFGGFKGLRRRLRKHISIKEEKLKFKRFDWSPQPYKIKEA